MLGRNAESHLVPVFEQWWVLGLWTCSWILFACVTSVGGYESIHAMIHFSDDPAALMLEGDSSISKDRCIVAHLVSNKATLQSFIFT